MLGQGIGASQSKQVIYSGSSNSSASPQTITFPSPTLVNDVLVVFYNAASTSAISSTSSGFTWSATFPEAAAAAPRILYGLCNTAGVTSVSISMGAGNNYGWLLIRELQGPTATTTNYGTAPTITNSSSVAVTVISTTGFSASGGIAILTSGGAQYNVLYTGLGASPPRLLGCKLVTFGSSTVTPPSSSSIYSTPIGAYSYSTTQNGITPTVSTSGYTDMLLLVVSGGFSLTGTPVLGSLTSGYPANVRCYTSPGTGQRNFAVLTAQEIVGQSSESMTTTWGGTANGFNSMFGLIHA